MLEVLGLILLIVILDSTIGTYRLQHWLGFAKEDEKWKSGQQEPAEKVAIAKCSFGASRGDVEGQVELNGATWNARALDETHHFDEGDKAKVEKVDGLTLVVSMTQQ